MTIPSPAIHLLSYLDKHKRNKGNTYGNIASQAGFTFRDEVERLCKILIENGLAELRDERVFITNAGENWLQQFIESRDDRIREFVYDNYEFALLRYVNELDSPLAVDDFPEVLKEQAPKRTQGSAALNLIHIMGIEWGHYFQRPNNRFEISKEGRKRYEYLAKQLGFGTKDFPQDEGMQSGFTEKEKKEMNAKVDQMIEMLKTEFETLKTGQEIIWTDMKADLEELKLFYNLSKKNWRQLLIGKFTEMVAAGVVSETISKEIVEFINPIAGNLLHAGSS